MVDYHLHTARCRHAEGALKDYLFEAEQKNLDEIGFADHFPLGLLDYTPRVQVTMDPEELEEYIEQVEELKHASSRVAVRVGIEIDYLPGTEKKLANLLKKSAFDYIIGSIHFMDGWDFTHPVYANDYAGRDIDALFHSYFELVWDACKSGLFDVIGHIDVIKKFGYQPSYDLEPLWAKTARLLKTTGTCLELNTAGRDAPVGEFYPDRRLLEMCFRENVPVTLGSDAHGPGQVGRYIMEAGELLKAVGYRELAVFERRKRKSVPLI